MKKRICVYGAVFLLIFCFSGLSMSGWKIQVGPVFSWVITHEDLTSYACQMMMGGISDGAKDHLVAGVQAPDDPTNHWADWAHYTDDPIDWDYTKYRRIDNRRIAATYGYLGQLDMCLYQVGTNFHSAQDFYTHTNYIYLADPQNYEIADLDADLPPPGLTGNGPGDYTSHSRGDMMTYLSLWATIREWELFEELFYGPDFNFDGNATTRLHNMGIISQIKPHIPGNYVLSFRVPAAGFVKGTLHELEWYHTAIPPFSPINIELLKDGAFEGYIFKSVEWDQLLLSADGYTWDFFHLTDEQGLPKETVPDNDYPRYQIRISVPGTSYSGTSPYFYIQVSVQGAPSESRAWPYGWGTIRLTWLDGSNCEQGFQVLRRIEGEDDFVVVKSVGVNVTAANDNTALPDVDYEYLIRATFANGYAHSNIVTSRTPGGPPAAPYELIAEMAPPRIVLNWVEHSNNEQGFIIEKKSEYDPVFYERARVGPNTEVFEDKNVSPGVTYWYRITAYNPNGTSTSEVVEILFDPMEN